MNPNIVEVTQENAQQTLVEESKNRPVLVDFWADWCEPCKNLMPVLEKLAEEYNGEFLLAKVNADEHQGIAQQLGVRSLPTVMLFQEGQPVDGFAGAQPESAVRELLEKYLPNPADKKLVEGRDLLAAGDAQAALAVLREAQAQDDQRADIQLAIAGALLALSRASEAKPLLESIKLADQDEYYKTLMAQLDLLEQAATSPEIDALEAELKANPDDNGVKLKLAVQYQQHNSAEQALELLLSILRVDLSFSDGEAKKLYTDILAVLGKSDPLAVKYQRKLYTLLY